MVPGVRLGGATLDGPARREERHVDLDLEARVDRRLDRMIQPLPWLARILPGTGGIEARHALRAPLRGKVEPARRQPDSVGAQLGHPIRRGPDLCRCAMKHERVVLHGHRESVRGRGRAEPSRNEHRKAAGQRIHCRIEPEASGCVAD
jgi:hypothetical protein